MSNKFLTAEVKFCNREAWFWFQGKEAVFHPMKIDHGKTLFTN